MKPPEPPSINVSLLFPTCVRLKQSFYYLRASQAIFVCVATAGFSDASFKMLKRERSLSYMNSKSFQNRNKLETQLHKIRTDREVLRDIIKPEPIPENVVPKPETESTTTVRDKDSVTSLITEQQNKSNNKMFSSKRINYCIVTSQEMRSACAVVVGLLVVLSNSGLRILSESVIVSSPLWSVVMTNMMMVVGLVFWENYREKEDVEFEKGQGQGQEDGSNMTDAILLMERGLVAYQMLRGIFIDFSVYFVVLVCGLSLV